MDNKNEILLLLSEMTVIMNKIRNLIEEKKDSTVELVEYSNINKEFNIDMQAINKEFNMDVETALSKFFDLSIIPEKVPFPVDFINETDTELDDDEIEEIENTMKQLNSSELNTEIIEELPIQEEVKIINKGSIFK